MNWRFPVAALVFSAAACAQEPADAAPPHLLEQARVAALNYTQSLPDFLCTEVIHRFEGRGATAPLHPSDVLTLQVSYFQFKENYKLVERNNKPTKASLESVGGFQSQGEFGTQLLLIFMPKSKAEFAFEEWSTLDDRKVAVYSYRVKRINSHFEMRMAQNSTIAGYHGEVFIDEATHMVLRIVETIDIPDDFPVELSHSTVDYAFADVGGRQFLLPVRCETFSADKPSRGRFGSPSGAMMAAINQMRYRNVIEFRDYRKYAAESSVSFDAPSGPPKQ